MMVCVTNFTQRIVRYLLIDLLQRPRSSRSLTSCGNTMLLERITRRHDFLQSCGTSTITLIVSCYSGSTVYLNPSTCVFVLLSLGRCRCTSTWDVSNSISHSGHDFYSYINSSCDSGSTRHATITRHALLDVQEYKFSRSLQSSVHFRCFVFIFT